MPAKKKRLEAKAEPKIAKGPTTRSGTLSAANKKPALKVEKTGTGGTQVSVTINKGEMDDRILASAADGPGLVEHGVGLGRHRPEDGPVPAPGTVILVAPERGA